MSCIFIANGVCWFSHEGKTRILEWMAGPPGGAPQRTGRSTFRLGIGTSGSGPRLSLQSRRLVATSSFVLGFKADHRHDLPDYHNASADRAQAVVAGCRGVRVGGCGGPDFEGY